MELFWGKGVQLEGCIDPPPPANESPPTQAKRMKQGTIRAFFTLVKYSQSGAVSTWRSACFVCLLQKSWFYGVEFLVP